MKHRIIKETKFEKAVSKSFQHVLTISFLRKASENLDVRNAEKVKAES